MSRIGLVVAVALGTCCLGGLLFTAGGLQASSRLVASARAWLDRELPPILSTWDASRLERLAAPEVLRRVGRAEIVRAFDASSKRLGKLSKYDGSTLVGYDPRARIGGGASVVASFRARATFERGPGSVSVRLVRLGSEWRFASFEVSDERRTASSTGW